MFPQMPQMVCLNQVTPGAAALLRVPTKHINIQNLKQNLRELLTCSLGAVFSVPAQLPVVLAGKIVTEQTALLCWDEFAQPHSQVQACCVLFCCYFLLLAPSQPSLSDSITGPCLTMPAITLLPGCEINNYN